MAASREEPSIAELVRVARRLVVASSSAGGFAAADLASGVLGYTHRVRTSTSGHWREPAVALRVCSPRLYSPSAPCRLAGPCIATPRESRRAASRERAVRRGCTTAVCRRRRSTHVLERVLNSSPMYAAISAGAESSPSRSPACGRAPSSVDGTSRLGRRNRARARAGRALAVLRAERPQAEAAVVLVRRRHDRSASRRGALAEPERAGVGERRARGAPRSRGPRRR